MEVRRRQLSVRTTRKGAAAADGVDEVLGVPVSPSARLVEHFYIVVTIGLATPLNLPVIRAGVEARIACYPRFRSIQVTDEDGVPRWVRTAAAPDLADDRIILPSLDPAAVAGNPDQAVEDYVASLSTLPMDRSRMLWELHCLDFPTSEAAATVAMRVHHSLADGVSLLTLLAACTRSAADPTRPPAMPPLPARRTGAVYARPPRPPASAGAMALAKWAWSHVELAWHTVVDVAACMAMMFCLKGDSHTLFKRRADMNHGHRKEPRPKRIVRRSLSLDDVKFVKDAINCTVNDVLVGVTNAALSRYYFRKSGDTDTDREIRLPSLLVVNLRPITSLQECVNMIESGNGSDVKWGNKVGFIIFPFLIAKHSDPLDYVRKAKKVVDRKKSSLEVVFTHIAAQVILKTFGVKAAAAFFRRMTCHATIAFSNMIGPVEQVEFCGHQVAYIASSSYAPTDLLAVNYQSYVNTINLSLSVDEAQFPDCHELLEDLAESLGSIKDAASSLGKHRKEAGG